ncbi:MAG: 5-formyltetrahydrofolate cyclo-ligase [Crocinitomix sp.]|nr:5-formyltetrahydrofolate cyclo-ligase [Crocinitomix sp.]
MDKATLRQQYKELRKNLSATERENASAAILKRAATYFDLPHKKISLFLPITRFLEINTWPFLKEIPADFYLPVVQENNQLTHIKYESMAQIKVNDWGIPEPIFGDTIQVELLDIVFVPLLAIDQKGYRVGYGKGFYDQFLINCNPTCIFVGLSYFDPIPEISDLHEFDIPLHYCVTPSEVWDFR